MNKPLVSIACLTFNHEKYINKAMDSFLCQETDFDFEIVVGDGGSTDKNREILKDYQDSFGSDKIKLLFPDNDPGIGGMLNQIFLACKGRYIAFCEGDDYWTDSKKIQRQADFLNQHNDYALIHSDLVYINSHGEEIEPGDSHYLFLERRKNGWVFDHLLKNGIFIYAPTVLYRKSMFPIHKLEQKNTYFLYDYWYWLLLSLHGKFYYENIYTATYRRHEQGLTHNNIYFKDRSYLLKLDIVKFAVEFGFLVKYREVLCESFYILLRGFRSFSDIKHLSSILLSSSKFTFSFCRYIYKYWLKKLL